MHETDNKNIRTKLTTKHSTRENVLLSSWATRGKRAGGCYF